jgi:pimeloyl-ACP methyl ester carboxylesterase
MDLFFRRFGEGPPLIILHGLFGSSGNWMRIGKALSEHFEVFIPDLRNHGNSPHSDEFSYPLLKDDLHSLMRSVNIEKAVIFGHSMGGKAAMFFTADFPEMVQSLIIGDISPRSYRSPEIQGQHYSDHRKIIEVMLGIDLQGLKDREAAEHILIQTLNSAPVSRFLLKNLHYNRDGNYSWKLNLMSLYNNLHHIMDGLDIGKFRNGNGITGFPVLFIRGEKSNYIIPEDIHLIKTIFPMAEVVTIPGAGHWFHAEKPEIVISTIRYFILGK